MGQAYWARTHDIRGTATTATAEVPKQRPGLRVKSFFFDVNEGGRSFDASDPTNAGKTTYRRTLNQFFRASKYGGFETDGDNAGGKPYNLFGNPFKKQNGANDKTGTNDNNVWQDPARPGEASTYYLSSSARGTLNAFDSIFKSATTTARSIAKSAVSNKNLTTAGSTIYQGTFDTSDWSGDVLSLPISLTGTSTVTLGANPNWSAATALSSTPATSRTIVIGREGLTPNPTASAFLWTSIDTSMQDNLNKLTPATVADTLGEDRLKYLRGDKSKEGSPFRTRSKLLGDVVNSGIVFSGTPSTNITPYTTAYSTFYKDNKSRTAAVFVGANDGMLHAFNATNGAELFGYIPSWMGPKLAALTANSYNANHQAYVDATPAVAEAQVGSAGTSADWKTVLVSGTGAGGPGVFALDVTDPTAFSASKVIWEFTKADDADMGYVVGRPRILKLRTSALATTPATYRWFAVVASGVNNYLPYPNTAGTFSATGNPALFLLALDKPVGTAWTSTGTDPNYYKLTVPVDTTLNATNATGLINFEAIKGPIGELSQIYMGDLHGKVWRLDFTQRGAADWNFDKLSFYKTDTDPYPLYAAKTSAGLVQPITMAPTIVTAGTDGGRKQNYVTFATGKYLENADKTSVAQNSFYALFENGSTSSPAGGAVIPGRGRLQAGAVNTTTLSITVPSFVWGRPDRDTDTKTRAGWYFDYVFPGEKSISQASINGDLINFGSVIPLAAGAAGTCAASGGGGNVYELNVDSGVGTFRRITTGIFGEQLMFDTDSATTYTISTSTGRRIKTIRPTKVIVTGEGLAIAPPTPIEIVSGRLSWRQINNYQDLKKN
jgi:type IV pilus assembly protein PilY1